MRQVRGDTLQQMEKFNYLEVVFTSDGRRSAKRLIHGLIKPRGQFCCNMWGGQFSVKSMKSLGRCRSKVL